MKKTTKNKIKEEARKEVFFIATKYQNNPAEVSFYTKDGKAVSENNVIKENTKEGVRLSTAVF